MAEIYNCRSLKSTIVFPSSPTSVYVQQMALGGNVRRLRIKNGWTLEKLSELSGVEVGTISALENRDSVTSKYARQLADAFGLSIEQLQDGDDSVAPAVDRELRAVAPPPLERSQEVEDVEISKAALELIRAWNALPLNERMDFKRRVESLALRYMDPVPDDKLTDLAAPGTPTSEKAKAAAKRKARTPGTQ